MTTPWRHGRRWMFRKRNSISKRSYKRTGRTSSERPSFDENSLYPTRNISFPPPQYPTGDQHTAAPSICIRRACVCPLLPLRPASHGRVALLVDRALRPARLPHGNMSDNRRPHMLPGSPGLFQTQGTPYSIPLSRSRDKITPRKPKTGTCHPCQSKSFTERGGPEERDAFPKAPSSPGKQAPLRKNYSSASVSASPAASSEAGPARGASATERSGIRHCPGRGAVSSAFSPT